MSIANQEQVNILEKKIADLESVVKNMRLNFKSTIQKEINANSYVAEQSEMQFGMCTALCVDTLDIWKNNSVRWYSPLFHSQKLTVDQLPWADPVTNTGGFDDCGGSWVPPAGSTVCIMFENGNRNAPYYIGTTWHRLCSI